MSAYLEKNSEHVQISKSAKIAAVIVSFCRLTLFSDSMTYILSLYEKSFTKNKQIYF